MTSSCAYHLTNRAVVQCSRCARPLCPACDHRIRGFPYCQDCIVAGVELLQQQQQRTAAPGFLSRKSSPFVATLLSFIVPGLGAAYNGQTSKALVHFTIFASFFQMATVTGGAPFFLLGVVGSWLFAAVDAARTAQLIRSGLAPDAESDAIARRLYGNPVAWGVVLLGVGGLFLLHVMGVVLPVRQFLPVVLVILGAYMLYDHLRHRTSRGDAVGGYDMLRRPPSAIGPGAFSADATRFGTGDLVAHTSARDAGVWPVDPRA
jgi:TM2 domain-containing membrane protein YozV